MVPVALSRLVIHEGQEEAVVFLKEEGGERGFPIIIGPFEAWTIDRILKSRSGDRPLTHELIQQVIEQLDASILRGVVDDLRDNTFHAKLVLRHRGQEVYVDARPSDVVALTLQVGAPLYVADKVMNAISG